MRLCLALGRTLAELGRSMSAAEFGEWVAYDRVEGVPWPWLQSGINAATVANSVPRKGGKTFRPSDFMPVRRRAARQTPQQMLAAFRLFAARHQPKGP